MKKYIAMILAALLMLSLMAGCGASPANNEESKEENAAEEKPAEENTAFVWSRQGYYEDADGNFLSVTYSDMEGYEGWSVGCMLGEEMHGWIIQQEGNTLHGDLDYDESHEFIVTVSEEGEDGLMMVVEGGDTYHFTPTDMPVAALTVTVNTEGSGQIAYAKEGEELQFDDDFPAQSAYLGLEGPETYVFGAKADEGWKFMKWTKDGVDYATEEQITMELTESAELVAVFGIAGKDETHVDLEAVTTLGELLGLPEYGYAAYENTCIYVFEQDGIFYRAIAECPEEVFDAVMELDFSDEQYEEKKTELISPLKVTDIQNLTEAIPTQEELDQLVGKTGEDLLSDGWTVSGWNLTDMEFYMDHGPFSYRVILDGTLENAEDFEQEDIAPLVVVSVTYEGLGDPTMLDDAE